MNYKLIHNEENLKKFIQFLPELKENESYFLILIARKKWNPDANIPSALKLKRDSVKKEYLIRTIKQWETEIGTYTTHDGTPIPNENLGVYISYNPKNQHNATFDLTKMCSEAIKNGNKSINVKSMANDAIQSANGSRNFIDIDVDVKEGEDYLEIKKFIESILNPSKLTYVKTSGGFHCLIDFDAVRNATPISENKNWHQAIKKNHPFKSDLNIMSHDLMPLVGCNQGKYVPHLF